MSEPQGPRPLFAEVGSEIFPGAWAAVFLTLAGLLVMSLVARVALTEFDFIAAIGLGQVVGLGTIAALAARRVPAPHTERMGLRGFDPRLLFPLLLLLPTVIVVSELDNWWRLAVPPGEAVTEAEKFLSEQTKIDSLYAGIQTAIVAVGIVPVVEGFFYFGIILQGLGAQFGRFRGAFVTAILYSIAHFPAAGTAGSAVIPLAFGLIAGSLMSLARLATGSVIAPMLLAAAFAAIHLAAIEARAFPAIPGFNADGAHTSPVIVIPCLLAVVYGALRLWRLAAVAEINPPIPPPEEPDDDETGFFF